ncbi:MAG: LysR family transcriptional regulator [Caulobacteraceae bacterium]|nr:LysR family transcriptional regulator [Caulobacteraceae bacterium]
MDRLASMEVFVRVAELGSFAEAARALDLSPQMVAKHIVFLEDRTGARLLQRTTRRQSLTEVGTLYLERCRALVEDARAADAEAQGARIRPRGRLRVNAPVTFGSLCLAPLVTRFLGANPEVEADIVLSDHMVDLVEDGFEAVIRIGPIGDSELIARRLRDYRLVACASPAYLAANGVPSAPRDLADHECLGFAYWNTPANRQWVFTRDDRVIAVKTRGRLRASNLGLLMQAALDGFGIVLAPEIATAEHLAAGRLIRVLAGYDAPARAMHLLYAPDRRMTPKLRAFIEMVIDEFGGSGKDANIGPRE